jgi:hypothetical protein
MASSAGSILTAPTLHRVRAENPVTISEQHVPGGDLAMTVPTRASMIVWYPKSRVTLLTWCSAAVTAAA